MLIRGDTFTADEPQHKSVSVLRFRGGILVREHFHSLPSSHLYLSKHADVVMDRSKAHNMLLGINHNNITYAPSYAEDESVCSTETTETFDQRIMWCVTCEIQTDGIGSHTGTARRAWLDCDDPADQLKMTMLKPLPLTSFVPVTPESCIRVSLAISTQIAKAINDFLVHHKLWLEDKPSAIQVKWPNDLGIVNSAGEWKKIGGTLTNPISASDPEGGSSYIAIDCINDIHRLRSLDSTRSLLELYFLISCGLNVNSCPSAFRDHGTSIKAIIDTNKTAVTDEGKIEGEALLNAILSALSDFLDYQMLQRWLAEKKALAFQGTKVDCLSEAGEVVASGFLEGINMLEGSLTLKMKNMTSIQVTPRAIRPSDV